MITTDHERYELMYLMHYMYIAYSQIIPNNRFILTTEESHAVILNYIENEYYHLRSYHIPVIVQVA